MSVDNAGNKITNVSNKVIIDTAQLNAPVLATGMTPVKWNASNVLTVTTSSDSEWYDYDSNKWANARTADGSMWVWIPRYIYKIDSGWHSNTAGTISIQFTKGVDDNWNSGVIGNINTDTSSNASNGSWTNHPAFTFGSTELKGIWVAKYEATSRTGLSTTYGADNVSTKSVKIVPNTYIWTSIDISNAFKVCRNMETDSAYGWGATGSGIDTHLIKNSEWGAVAYLTHSKYGRNGVKVSPSSASNSLGSNNILNLNYGSDSVDQSTTGNMTGIFAMSGGNNEWVAAYVNNGNASLTNYGSALGSADIKYKDVYTITTDTQANNYVGALDKRGDAIYETSSSSSGKLSWFNGTSDIPVGYNMFLRRGGVKNGSESGIFSFSNHSGTYQPDVGFRPTLAVGSGL
ncbi:hypothetical protein D3C76_971320 [compost metagenome]